MGVKTVKLSLTGAEKALLLQVVGKHKTLQKVLRFSQSSGDIYTFVLTQYEAESIGDLVMSTLLKSSSKGIQHELQILMQHIAAAIMESIAADSIGVPNLPKEMKKVIEKVIKGMPMAGVDEINAELAKANEKYNNTGQDCFQGLSPNQLNKLIYFEMDTPDSAIQLNKNIPLTEFSGAPFLNNSRILLHAAIEGLPVTASGNLNRKSTEILMDAFTISDDERERTLEFNKVLNEGDVRAVHIVRVICELAGLVEISKNAFRITKSGQRMLAAEKAGELFALLFFTYFRNFKLGYVDGCPDLPGIQGTIGYSLYVASKMDKWTEMELAAKIVFLPTILDEVYIDGDAFRAGILARTRLLVPLNAFGLMECEIGETMPYKWKGITRVRKTKLFDQFLRFNIGAPQKHTGSSRFSKPRLN